MQGKNLLLAVCGIAAISIGTSAQALEMSSPCGWYVEGNVGSVHFSNFNNDGFNTSSSGWGANINGGYKFLPYGALEIGYTQYPDGDVTIDDIDGTNINIATVKHYSYDIAAKGILPISDTGFEVFAKLGAQHINTRIENDNDLDIDVSGSHSSTGIYYGLGFQFNIMAEMGIVAQWQRAQGSSSTGTADLFSIGVAFIFV